MTRPLRTLPVLVLLFALTLSPSFARAQVLEEDMNSYVKKGLFLSLNTGLYVFAVQPSNLTSGKPAAPSASPVGLLAGLEMGFDISPMFALTLSVMGTHVQGNSQVGGGNSNYMFVLNGLISFLKNDRLHVFARVGVGASLAFPQDVVPAGLVAQVGGGARLFTRLKGFSFAIELFGLLTPPVTSAELSLGIALMPSVMYTF